jgi:tetratricopeptide (TPR) repeat protein
VTEIFKALDVMALINSQLGSAKLELFEQRLFNLTDPVASASCDVEFLFGSPTEPQTSYVEPLLAEDTMSADERMARRSFVNRLIRSARAIARVDICLERLLALVEASIRSPQFNQANSSSRLYPELKTVDGLSSQLLDSELFEDVLSRGFSQAVSSGFDLLRDTMHLGLLCIRAELQLNLNSAVLKNLHALLPRIAEQLKAYHVLKWFSMQHITGNPIEPDMDLPMRRLGPKLAANASLLRQRLDSAPMTAIRLYIMDIRSEISDEHDDHSWRAVRNLIPAIVHLVHPHSVLGDKCSLANQLLFRGQHLSLFEYVRLLNSKSAYHRDLLGDCYLALAQYEKAIECFVQASINIELETNAVRGQWPPMTSSTSHMVPFANQERQNPLVLSVRQALGRDSYEKESLGLYYWKALIPDLVEQKLHDLVIKAANCALSCTHPSDEATFSELYLHIFKAALAIEYHEQAYAAMIHITEDARRMDALSEFVLFFIERGKARELAELPFVNMLDQVHSIIMNRAKSSEMIQPHPNLYQVLYAFHIAKANYRLAAECIFVYADRLSVEHHVGLNILERYSAAILAVLTALKLIDPQHAYLTTRRSTSSSATASPSKRPRDADIASDFHSLAIEKQNSGSKDMQALRHVEVYDIPRLELLHLLAQCNLQLARKNRSLALTGLKSPTSTLALLLDHSEFALGYRLAHASKLKMDDIFARHALERLCLPASKVSTEAERWGELRTHLQTYDSPTTNFHYHYVVADAILSADHRINLPIWLVYTFKTGQIAPTSTSLTEDSSEPQSVENNASDKNMQLMSLYLKHRLLEDAAKLASEMILRASHNLEAYTDPTAPFQTILPYQHIEQVLLQLQPINAQLHAKVASALTRYIDLAVDKVNLKMGQEAD